MTPMLHIMNAKIHRRVLMINMYVAPAVQTEEDYIKLLELMMKDVEKMIEWGEKN